MHSTATNLFLFSLPHQQPTTHCYIALPGGRLLKKASYAHFQVHYFILA